MVNLGFKGSGMNFPSVVLLTTTIIGSLPYSLKHIYVYSFFQHSLFILDCCNLADGGSKLLWIM